MDWTIPLRSQQADFIERLKSGHLLHCEKEGQHSELTVISGERLEQMREFCWVMVDKYKYTPSKAKDVFLNTLKGKLGEEVVKARLGDFVTEVDYKKTIGGDGKVDFTLSSDSSVGIQVKARHGNIDTVRWSIGAEEVEKNTVLVCILIQEEVSQDKSEYHLVLAGFLPSKMIEVSQGKRSFGINDLLYAGGLRGYLEKLDLFESDNCLLTIADIQKNGEQTLVSSPDSSFDKMSKACTYFSQGLSQITEKNYERAIDDFNEAILLYPTFNSPFGIRAVCYLNLGDYQRVIEDCNESLNLILINAAKAYQNRGKAYLNSGDIKRAIKDFSMGIQINPKYANTYFNRGCAYEKLGNFQEAINDFSQVIQIDPNNADYYNKRGCAHGELGNFQEAINDFSQAIKIDPNNADYYNKRGSVHGKLGDNQRASEDFSKAIQINPEYTSAYENRSIARIKLGDAQGASEDLSEAKRQNKK